VGTGVISIIQGSHASWKVLENHFGPGRPGNESLRSWKVGTGNWKMKILDS